MMTAIIKKMTNMIVGLLQLRWVWN